MSDARLRQLERAWQQAPGDHEALARLIGAKRRAGESVPGWMLDQQLRPGRTLEPGFRFDVYADLPGEGVLRLGKTTRSKGIEVPPHYAVWVRPISVGKALGDVVAAVREHAIPGLALDRAQVTTAQLHLLKELPRLTWLSLAGCTRITGPGLATLAENLPHLQHLDLDRCARRVTVRAEHLRRMPDLIHLCLRDRGGDPEARIIAENAPKLTRLRVGGAGLTNAGLEALGELAQLTRLEISYSGRVSSKGLRALANLPRLLHLDLVGCVRMKGPSLKVLARLPNLASLGFYPVGPWGMWRAVDAEDLRGLGALRNLEHLTVLNQGVYHASESLSGKDQEGLRSALPDCQVVYAETFPEYWFLGPTGTTVASG